MSETGCLLALEHARFDVPVPRPTEPAPSARDGAPARLRRRERRILDTIQRPAFGVAPQRGVRRRVVTILWDPHKDDVPERADVETMREVMHGTVESVRDYFLEVSQGQFTIEDAGVLGWYDSDHPPEAYWPGGGEVGRDSGAEAIRKAARDLDFSAFDEDGDGELRPDELAVVFIQPGRGLGGGLIRRVGDDFLDRGEGNGVVVDGVRVLHIAEVSIGAPPRPGIVAHELCHLLLNLGDMYFSRRFNPVAAGPYSIMDQHGWAPHLDPVHKLKLGWLSPRLWMRPGTVELPAVSEEGEALVLASLERGAREYFVVENRYPTGSYDARIPHRGIGVWHVIDDADTFDRYRPPIVSEATWGRVGGWSRKGIRMVRPSQAMPFGDTLRLWDGGDDETVDALVSQQRHAEHGTLRWADGSPSGFALSDVPAAGPKVELDIDTRWEAGSGIRAVTGNVTSLSVCDDDPYHHLDANVVVEIDSRPDEAFGFPLRQHRDLHANVALLSKLRAAADGSRRVRIEYDQQASALRRIIRVATP
jgi:M6 family metalloprotease-like protein